MPSNLATLGTGGASSTLPNGLISYWKLDEASGAAVDSVGGNTLTDNNTVTSAAGKIGTARQFTAANSEWLSIVDNPALSIIGDLTMSAWVWLDTKTGVRYIAGKNSLNSAVTIEYSLWYSNASDRFTFSAGNGAAFHSAVANTFGAVATGAWNYVVGKHVNGATVQVSANGGAFDSVAHTTGIQDSGAAFRIGDDGGGAGRFMDGRIDDLKLWNRVLTAGEIAEDYANGLAGRTLL